MSVAVKKTVESLGLISAAIDKGQGKDGVQNGPKEIWAAGLNDLLAKLDAKITDYGEVTNPKEHEKEQILQCNNQRTFLKTTEVLTKMVHKSVSENDLTIVLGGDHSIGTGVVAGHFMTYPDSFIIWVDAHADLNTPAGSNSKNSHGMTLSFLVNETSKLVPQAEGFEKIKPLLDARRIIYIALRDADLTELKFIKEFSIPYFDMYDIGRIGIKGVMELTMKLIAHSSPNARIHLSFDIDSLDPSIAPSTGTLADNGLTLEQGKYICKTIAQTGQLKSFEIVEVNTSLGTPEDAKKTVNSAVEILKSLLQID